MKPSIARTAVVIGGASLAPAALLAQEEEGDYNCRARGDGRSAVDRTTRGKFTVVRSG